MIYYYKPKSIAYLEFLSFSLMFFFCSRTPSRTHCIWLSCLLRLFLALSVPQFFLVFGDILRNTGQVFYKIFLKRDLSDIFLMIRLGLWSLRKKRAEEKTLLITSYQGYILSTQLITVDYWKVCSFTLQYFIPSPQITLACFLYWLLNYYNFKSKVKDLIFKGRESP